MRKVLILSFLLINTVLSATDYYVKNGGNDSNSGLDDANAWAHHPWMSTWTGKVILAPGDVVWMKRGGIWSIANPTAPFIFTTQSGSPGKHITTTAYGTGNDPVIEISTRSDYPVIMVYGNSYLTFDHLHIQHCSSTYISGNMCGILIGKRETTVPHQITITNCEMHNIPKTCVYGGDDSHHIVIGDTTAKQTATATRYSNHFHHFGYAGVILQGANPENNESHFYVYYNYVHDATGNVSGDNAYGIEMSATPSSSAWPKYATVRYNRVENIKTWKGIGSHGGSYLYFIDNYIKNFGANGIGIGCLDNGTIQATSNHIYIERNIIEQPSSGWVPGHENSFIMQYSSSTTIHPSDIYIRDNAIFYTSRPASGVFFGIRLENVDGATVSGNKIYNGGNAGVDGGIYLGSDYASGEKNVTITKNFIHEWGPGISLSGGGITGSVAITNNIITKPAGAAAISIVARDISSTGTITIYSNTLISDGGVYCFGTGFGIAPGGSLVAKNNNIGRTSLGSLMYWYWGGTISGTFICDYNIYWNSTFTTPFYLSGANSNWTAWNVRGYDTHSINNTDPLFLNKSGLYSESSDFILQGTSPAINKGTLLSEVTNDFFSNPRDDSPDIGAYEYNIADPIVLITGITLTGSGGSNTIITDKGTLQLVYSVTPANAADKTVTWSIANGTGQAKISATDLVTAVSNGTVTARATANDGSGIYGTLVIVISNQVIPAIPVYVSSAIENATPSRLEMTYSLTLTNSVPAASAFAVKVNSVAISVTAVAVSGNKVILTLPSPVVYGNVVTVAYTKPVTNPIKTAAGGEAASISARTVANRVNYVNASPVVVVNYTPTNLTGFVGEISASGSYDPNSDKLSYEWIAPENVPISSSNTSTIKFLGPVVDKPKTYDFIIKISDGKITQSKILPVEVIPYKPELEEAKILKVEASTFQYPNFPFNILDGNIGTMWAADGPGQWLLLYLKEPYKVDHVILAFQSGMRSESYFDILGSTDNITWEPILTKSASCGFSGNLQVFSFPAAKSEIEYSFIKLIGHSNSVNTWNYISEFKLFGFGTKSLTFKEQSQIIIYPNPAHEFVNILIKEPSPEPDFIRIINLSGRVVFQDKINPDVIDLRIPVNFKKGFYIIQIGTGEMTLFTQKLIIS